MTPEELERYSRSWHLDKRLNVGHITATLLLAVGVFAWAGAIDSRVAVLEALVLAQDEEEARKAEYMAEMLRQMREDLRELRTEVRALRSDRER